MLIMGVDDTLNILTFEKIKILNYNNGNLFMIRIMFMNFSNSFCF